MKEEKHRRHRLLVKSWLQFRLILLLLGGISAGGVAYALLLQELLRRRIEPELAASHVTLGGENLWISLYPTVALATVLLAAAVGGILFLLLRAFAARVSRASSELEQYYAELASGGGDPSHEGRIRIREFRHLAHLTTELFAGHRRKWAAIGEKADAALAAAARMEKVGDPTQRLIALRECERKTGTLIESCRPRQRGRS